MKTFFTLILTLILFTTYAQTPLPKEFTELLSRAGMQFTEPKGYKQVAPVKNRQMNWELAYSNTSKKLEVRYAIRPMDNHLKEYEKAEITKNPGDINIHPNKWFKSTFEATVLNISGGQLPEYGIFDKKAVKSEFNADWGATITVNVIKEFGQGFMYCLIVALHKDNLGDAYIFYLADDRDLFGNEMLPIFHCLKFK